MKRLLFLFLMIFPSIARAEGNLESLLNEDKMWIVGYFSPYLEGRIEYIEFKLEGDTIIGGVVYKRQYQKLLELDDDKLHEWQTTGYFIGQTDNKFYYYNKTFHKDPQLLLDFSVTAGDIIPYMTEGMSGYLKVENVSDTIFANASDKQNRKCIYVRDMEYDVSDVWIEGIGSLNYGIEPYFMNHLTGSVPQLLICKEDDKILYAHADAPVIANIYHPSVQESVVGSAIYDLQGRRLTDKPTKGIYIQNGKKVVVK